MFILLEDEILIGYICMFPIKPQLYDRILREDRLFDSDISPDMVEEYVEGRCYKLYLISVVIRPEFQKMGLSKYLIKGFYNFIEDKKLHNIEITSILATSVSDAGCRFLDKLNFIKVKQVIGGYWVHELIL